MIILYSKSMRLFMGSGFFVSHLGLRKPRHFYGVLSLRIMSDHNWRVFHPRGGGGGGGDLSQLADTWHIFSLPFQSIVRLCWTLSHLTEPTQSNTKRSVDFPTMYSHSFNSMSSCICNAIMSLRICTMSQI